MSYTKTNWQSLPNTKTPMDPTNLNKIEDELESLDLGQSNLQNQVDDVNTLINEMIDYKEEEIELGKWIDGKTVYIKVVPFITPDVADKDALVIDNLIENCDNLIRIYGSCKQETNVWDINTYYANNYYIALYYNQNLNQLRGKVSSNLISKNGYIILQYTKTI